MRKVLQKAPAAPEVDPDAIDFQIPMASLMGRLDDWPNSFVPRSPYLIPDPDQRDIFENRLRDVARGRPLIGIAWRSARKKRGPLKSLPLADWTPILADRDALFINLQYGDTDDEIAAAGRLTGAEIYTDPSLDRMASTPIKKPWTSPVERCRRANSRSPSMECRWQ